MPDSQIPADSVATVSLREITAETLRSILSLSVTKEQEKFVASNAVSIAQAHFSEHAWFRAIYADETPVGFLMLYDDPEKAEYFLWRFMIDQEHQRKGYGRRALELLIEYVKTRPNAKELFVSHAPGDGSPGGFYRKLGFEYTGEEDHGELVMKLSL
jgi:diamine N-acetyltransferase